VMYFRLYNHLQTNSILNQYQFGFRKNYSTTLALIEVIDKIYLVDSLSSLLSALPSNSELVLNMSNNRSRRYSCVGLPLSARPQCSRRHPQIGHRVVSYYRSLFS